MGKITENGTPGDKQEHYQKGFDLYAKHGKHLVINVMIWYVTRQTCLPSD